MTKSPASGPSPRWQRFLPWLGALIGLAVLAWLLRRFDFDRFLTILAEADIRYVMLIPLAIATEQLVRGWKWRQILYPLRSVGTLPLFGAIMAGYLLGLLIPFGFAALARSWLVARREGMPMSAVLATVALDRLTDGVVSWFRSRCFWSSSPIRPAASAPGWSGAQWAASCSSPFCC